MGIIRGGGRTSDKLRKDLRDYLSSGSSREQQSKVEFLIEQNDLSPEERGYFDTEVIPMTRILLEASIDSREKHFMWGNQVMGLGLAMVILGAVSSTPLVPEASKYVCLLISSVLGSLQAYKQAEIQQRQPALDWISARRAYDSVIAESIARLSRAEIYASIDSEKEMFIIFVQRVSGFLCLSEMAIQRQIESYLTSSVDQESK
jgi:hypothetical protein